MLFYALLNALDAGEDATDADLAMMDRLHRELAVFCESFDQRALSVLHGRRPP